jgi:tRNA threonylcarbamoyladenosine biosynthesis protein TsaB
MSTPLILSLDTATLDGSICLSRGETVLASQLGDAKISHSISLLTDIDQMLGKCGIAIDQVELFAVASGPGSFTGLRIGLATVKALSATLKRPCIGIPTLHAVAGAGGASAATVALLPAGRGELFAQLLAVAADGSVTAQDAPAHLAPAALMEKYGRLPDLKWAGIGAHSYRELIGEQATLRGFEFSDDETAASKGWRLARREENLAREIATLAHERVQHGGAQSAESLSALYVRPSDPELKEHAGN